MARKINYGGQTIRLQARKLVLTCEDPLERAKGIEPSWPAWKVGTTEQVLAVPIYALVDRVPGP
jgi:hypothetical protein